MRNKAHRSFSFRVDGCSCSAGHNSAMIEEDGKVIGNYELVMRDVSNAIKFRKHLNYRYR